MTVYAVEADELVAAIETTLAEHVLPHVADGIAQQRLADVLEMLANIRGRVEWGPAQLAVTLRRTRGLADELGVADTGSASVSVASLAEQRRQIGRRLADVYRGAATDVDAVVAAVAEFSATDINDAMTIALRRSPA